MKTILNYVIVSIVNPNYIGKTMPKNNVAKYENIDATKEYSNLS